MFLDLFTYFDSESESAFIQFLESLKQIFQIVTFYLSIFNLWTS